MFCVLGYAINPDADGTKGEEYVGDRIGAEEAKGETNIRVITSVCLSIIGCQFASQSKVYFLTFWFKYALCQLTVLL